MKLCQLFSSKKDAVTVNCKFSSDWQKQQRLKFISVIHDSKQF